MCERLLLLQTQTGDKKETMDPFLLQYYLWVDISVTDLLDTVRFQVQQYAQRWEHESSQTSVKAQIKKASFLYQTATKTTQETRKERNQTPDRKETKTGQKKRDGKKATSMKVLLFANSNTVFTLTFLT